MFKRFIVYLKLKCQLKRLKTVIEKLNKKEFDIQLELLLLQAKPSYTDEDIIKEIFLIKLGENISKIKCYSNSILPFLEINVSLQKKSIFL